MGGLLIPYCSSVNPHNFYSGNYSQESRSAAMSSQIQTSGAQTNLAEYERELKYQQAQMNYTANQLGAITQTLGGLRPGAVSTSDSLDREIKTGQVFKATEDELKNLQKEKENKSMLKEFRQYLSEHRDLVFSVLLLFVADSFFLNGALRAKLQSILHKVVEKVEKKVDAQVA